MKQKCITKRSWVSRVAVFLSLAVVFSSVVTASAKSIDSMDALELVKEADLRLKTQRFDEAVPYLQIYLDKFGEEEDFRIVRMSQDVRFKLGKLFYVNLNNPGESVPYLQEYVDNRPAPDWYEAMKILSIGLLETFKYEQCVEIAEAALVGPTNEIKVVKQTHDVEEDEEEGAELKLDAKGNIIVDEEAMEAEKEVYTLADRVVLNRVLGEAYFYLGEVEKAIEPFLFVAENDTVAVRRGYAIKKAIEAMVELEQFDELTRLIPALYQTDARYDIRVNMAIMSAAASLFNAEQYDQALIMYRMVLPREELIEFQNLRIIKLKHELGLMTDKQLLDALTEDQAVELGIDYTLLGQATKMVTEEVFYDRDETDAGKSPELIQLEQLVATLVNLSPYENDVVFRTAFLYDTVDRPWEAVEVFNALWEKTPETDIGQKAFYQAKRVLLQTLDRPEALEQCYAILKDHKEGLMPRQIAYLITQYYQQNDQIAEVKKVLPYLEEFAPSDDPQVLKYDTELYYMQAIADVVGRKFKEAKAGFELVLNRFPGSHQMENASYWHAMTMMFLQEYEEALPEFEAYLEKYPEGRWVASANFQIGTCLFGMEKFQEAKKRFTIVIEQYPESSSYPDALSMRGDILASEEDDEDAKEGEYKLDLAIADYQEAIRATAAVYDEEPARAQKQATYATFQLATVYELLAKTYKSDEYYERIIEAVRSYLDFYGTDANISKGIYWIGKTRINQGRVDEAAQSYLNAIVEYGNDLEQDGVDFMITDLVSVSRRFTPEQREPMLDTIRAEMEKAEDVTLKLRLRAMNAQLTRTEIEFGKELITELDDLSVAAPPVLSAMSKASFQEEDYSRAEEILEVFNAQFDESQYIRSAYKLRAFDLYESGDLNQAKKIIKEAQERFGPDADMAWAQLMKSDIMIQQGKYEEAKEQLMFAMNQPQWRGAPYAEANYRMGMAEELSGEIRTGFGWYQRAYFQYGAYADGHWAAQAYLASARCLQKLGLPMDVRNTYRAMLFDENVNDLPEAEVARNALGEQEVQEIMGKINAGIETNINVTLDAEAGE